MTNGMSEFARNRENINGALLVNVTPEDFGDGPLSGIAFQRRLEEAAYAAGGGGYLAPAQRVEDFLQKRSSIGPGRVIPSYRPGVTWSNLWSCLPPFVAQALAEALPILGQKLRGYDAPGRRVDRRGEPQLLSGADSSGARGVSPPSGDCTPGGEGAGYAGGILSAAADGMRCAEQLCAALATPTKNPF